LKFREFAISEIANDLALSQEVIGPCTDDTEEYQYVSDLYQFSTQSVISEPSKRLGIKLRKQDPTIEWSTATQWLIDDWKLGQDYREYEFLTPNIARKIDRMQTVSTRDNMYFNKGHEDCLPVADNLPTVNIVRMDRPMGTKRIGLVSHR
jgi:hypothetical protein